MCRLFGMSSGPRRVRATFWLLDAPDSLAEQSRREPDGTGLGTFDADGTPRVEKQPIAAYQDKEFAREARERESSTFIAHIRYASTGGLDVRNTHPFCQHNRLFAHNGVIASLDALEAELGEYRELVAGDTDSERFFALITKHVDLANGDVTAGITAASRWVADNLPLYAINLVLTTATELWALRYPATHDLFVLDRAAGGRRGDRHLDHASPAGTVRTRSGDLARNAAVVVATERMDEDPDWRALEPGELLHVSSSLRLTRHMAVDHPPAHLLSLDELSDRAALSQS
ncbi:class II glutamine amidotransferase [Actinocrispum wychmicini]|uniref:Glutamine amidotransferase n=1 Tax=Actinocrispum wychmicini TaxID=1213861 RepID=A0A4R2J713_9PSEU|nr:class II glutamine amidotransferase [Actinocrispum wychmicini]TCO54294.1 glutamine amidotransferase [Actinocrispum wychmicini]